MGSCLTKKNKKLINKIGVSVYDVDELEEIIDTHQIDIVQLPSNIFDQRFMKSGILARLKSLEVEIHARSTFLQGLLLRPLEVTPLFCLSNLGFCFRYLIVL